MVEPEAAKIVRRIFEEYASGDGVQSIIDRLFEDRVHRISDYNQYHHVYCQDGENLHQWGNSSIRAVLNRNNYYGDLVQRKYESRFQRGEKWCDILDESQWIITPNAHEPIISRELFEKAQVRLKAAQQKATKTTAGGKMMKEHFTMYSIVVIVSGKCVHVDTEAMCITFAMLPGIGMKENVVTNLFPKRSCRKLSVRS